MTLKLALLWAGSHSRPPSRHPFPTYTFLGLTKEAGVMTVQNQQNTYIYIDRYIYVYVWYDICIILPNRMILSFLPPSGIFCLLMALWWLALLSPQINWKLIWPKSIFSSKSEPIFTRPKQLHMHRATGPSDRCTGEQGLLLLALLDHVGSRGAVF